MKNNKKVFSLILMAFCFCIMMFGVYALKSGKMTGMGTVGLIAHDAEISVWGSFEDVVTDADDMSGNTQTVTFFTEEAPYTFKDKGEFTLDQSILKDEENNSVEQVYFSDAKEEVPFITFTLNVRNESIFTVFPEIKNLTAGDNIEIEIIQDITAIKSKEVETLILKMSIIDTEVSVETSDNFNLEIDFVKYYKLVSPKNIKVDRETNQIDFDEVPEAESYTLAYMKDGEILSIQNLPTNSGVISDFPRGAGEYEVYLKANATESNELANDSEYAYVGKFDYSGISLYVENGKLYTNIGSYNQQPIRWFAYAKKDENGTYVPFTQVGTTIEAGEYKFISEKTLSHTGINKDYTWFVPSWDHFNTILNQNSGPDINGNQVWFKQHFSLVNDPMLTASSGTRVFSRIWIPSYDEFFGGEFFTKEDLLTTDIASGVAGNYWTSTNGPSTYYIYGVNATDGTPTTFVCNAGHYIRAMVEVNIVV